MQCPGAQVSSLSERLVSNVLDGGGLEYGSVMKQRAFIGLSTLVVSHTGMAREQTVATRVRTVGACATSIAGGQGMPCVIMCISFIITNIQITIFIRPYM